LLSAAVRAVIGLIGYFLGTIGANTHKNSSPVS
jgi:hypothetical protein